MEFNSISWYQAFMKNIIILFSFVLISCKPQESIDVHVKPEPIQFYLSVPIDPLEVEDQFSDIEEVDVIGGVFGELAEMMANAEIEEGELGNFAFTPCLYEIEELKDINFDYIKGITLDSIRIDLNSSDESANFSFVEFAEGHIRPLSKEEFDFLKADFELCSDMSSDDNQSKDDEESPAEDVNYWDLDVSDMKLAFNYVKKREIKGTTIYPTVNVKDWRGILEKNNHLLLFFRVKIDKVPDYDFSVSGDINLNIDIDLKQKPN